MVDQSFHYTNEQMVKDLLSITPILYTDTVLDAGSGKNKVWYNNVNVKEKYECEIEDGCDFFAWDKKVDWVIGNPPFRSNDIDGKRINLLPMWVEKSSDLANKGMAFLINHKIINFLTPVRLQKLFDKGFVCTHIHIVSDARWFGRYYYIIFVKGGESILTWTKRTYVKTEVKEWE
jgi:hypothetical protein